MASYAHSVDASGCRLREKLLDGRETWTQPLLIDVADHRLQDRSIRREPVGPVVLAHQYPRLLELGDQPGHRAEERPRIAQPLEPNRLRPLERVVERLDDPRVAVVDLALDDHRV